MRRFRFTIGQFLWLTVAAGIGLAIVRGIESRVGPIVALGISLLWDRVREPDVAIPIAVSLVMGVVAHLACRQVGRLGPSLIEGAYVMVMVAAALVGQDLRSRADLLADLTLLAYPTILGAGLGSQAASRRLPTDRPASRLDDLVFTLTVVPLLFFLPALVHSPVRQILIASGWLN